MRNTRSGCGIRIVARPSVVVRPVMPPGEPFGLAGYVSATLAVVVDEAQAHQPARAHAVARRGLVGELRATLAVRDGDRQHRAGHAREEDRRRRQHLDQARRGPRTAPSGCARSAASAPAPGISDLSADIIWQPLQTPSVKVSRAREERRELLAQRGVEQDRLGPALAGAEHVAVGEAAAGDEPAEVARAARGPRSGRSCARRPARTRRDRTPPPSRPGCSRPARAGSRSRGRAPRSDVRRSDVLGRDRTSARANRPGILGIGGRARTPRARRPGCRAAPACGSWSRTTRGAARCASHRSTGSP